MLAAWWLSTSVALAGAGPWVLGAGDEQIYVGLDAQRFGLLATGAGAYADDVVTVDDGVNTFGAKLIGTLGLVRNVELELDLPFAYTYVNRIGDVCALLALDACETTYGFAPITLRTKWLVVDELAGRPVSFSVGVDLRFGQMTAEHRERITNIGDGTFDLEPRVSLGRIGRLPNGWWSIYGDVSFRYRFPTDPSFGDTGIAVPGYEIVSNVENLWTPVSAVSIGPAIGLLWRPNGVDILSPEWAATDQDRIVALRILSLEAGAKLIVRNNRAISGSLGVFHTIYAINNPQDTFKISLGVAFRDLVRKREE